MNNETEPWMDLNKWEQQCIDEIEKTPELEIELQNAKDTSEQKLWLLFQNAATCVTQLYKGKIHLKEKFYNSHVTSGDEFLYRGRGT